MKNLWVILMVIFINLSEVYGVQVTSELMYKNLSADNYVQVVLDSDNSLIVASERNIADVSGIWVSKYFCYINGRPIKISANNWRKVRLQILESLNPSIPYERLANDEYSKIILDINGKPWIEKTSKAIHKTGTWASKHYAYINGKKIINTPNNWVETLSEIIGIHGKIRIFDSHSPYWASDSIENLTKLNIIQNKNFYDNVHLFNPVNAAVLDAWISNSKNYIDNQQKFLKRIDLANAMNKLIDQLVQYNPTVINELTSLMLNYYTLNYFQESGITKKQFFPYRFTNRAQAVVLLDRIINMFNLDMRYLDENPTLFVDLNETHWAHSSLQNLIGLNIIQKQDFYDKGQYAFQPDRFIERTVLNNWLSKAYAYINHELDVSSRATWSLNIHGGYNFGPTEYNSKKQTALGIEIARHIKQLNLSLISKYSSNMHITREDRLRSNQVQLGIRKSFYKEGQKNASIYVGGGATLITPQNQDDMPHNQDDTMLSMYAELGSIITRVPFDIGINVSAQENPMGMSVNAQNHRQVNRDMVFMASLFLGKSF